MAPLFAVHPLVDHGWGCLIWTGAACRPRRMQSTRLSDHQCFHAPQSAAATEVDWGKSSNSMGDSPVIHRSLPIRLKRLSWTWSVKLKWSLSASRISPIVQLLNKNPKNPQNIPKNPPSSQSTFHLPSPPSTIPAPSSPGDQSPNRSQPLLLGRLLAPWSAWAPQRSPRSRCWSSPRSSPRWISGVTGEMERSWDVCAVGCNWGYWWVYDHWWWLAKFMVVFIDERTITSGSERTRVMSSPRMLHLQMGLFEMGILHLHVKLPNGTTTVERLNAQMCVCIYLYICKYVSIYIYI